MDALAPRPDDHLELLVLQPTPFCNLDCSYCYLAERSNTARMPFATLRRAVERVLESRFTRDELTIVWHAGEPLVLPVSWYEEAFAAIRDVVGDRDLTIHHAFQTNGTLIDEAWCDFIRRHGIRVGVSIDGPAHLHDRNRVLRDGRGTHALAMRGIRRLQQAGIDLHVISVLTAESLEHPDALFDFYRDVGIRRVGFNIEELEGENTSSSLHRDDGDAPEERVRAFMSRFLERLHAEPGVLTVRELSGLGNAILHAREDDAPRGQESTPMRILNVGFRGEFSTYSPELLGVKSEAYGGFALGNVHTDAIDASLETERFRRLENDVAAGIERCRRECPFFFLCGGGSPANKYFENGTLASTETMHCRLSRQVIAEVVLDDLERVLAVG